jgi:hypothetical protein
MEARVGNDKYWRDIVMKVNVGRTDRIGRLIAGIAIIGAGLYFQSWWGLIGIVPLVTGSIRFCPLYAPFNFSTCSKEEKAK